MAMAESSTFEDLNSTNYSIWAVRIKYYLQEKNLLSVVELDGAAAVSKSNDLLAFSHIMKHIGENTLFLSEIAKLQRHCGTN